MFCFIDFLEVLLVDTFYYSFILSTFIDNKGMFLWFLCEVAVEFNDDVG